MIDSGWDRTITENRVARGVGFVHPDNHLELLLSDDDHDRIGHGTACANILLQVAPEATIVPLRVFGSRLETSVETIIAALDHAASQRIPLINLSLATRRPDALLPLYRACDRARRQGMLIVAAAYNVVGGGYPAIFDSVISVDIYGPGERFAFRYSHDAAVECSVAEAIGATSNAGDDRSVRRGTSFAAPVVTGWIARYLETNPHASLDEVRAHLESVATIDVDRES
jgi:subtilisin family serine protease